MPTPDNVAKELPEPHPVTGCRHTEGAVVDHGRIVRWLPAVHDCRYVDARNAFVAAHRMPPALTPVRPLALGWR